MQKWVTIRIWMAAVFLGSLLMMQAGWLAHLQLGDHSRIDRHWAAQLEAPRGGIYDRRGKDYPLAVSLPGELIFIDPATVSPEHDKVSIACRVAETLNLDTDQVLVALNRKDTRYIELGVTIDTEIANRLRGSDVSGVHLVDRTVRHYPLGRKMSHVLGFVNAENIGSAGVEQRFHSLLQGTAGFLEGKVDARRHEIYRERNRYVPPIPGADVMLTLDLNVQYILEQALDDGIDAFSATGGWAIVQRVRTGEILAMAARPDFDPNHYRFVSQDLWRNRAIADVFEPGSTMKALVVAAALNEGLATPETMIECGTGVWMYAGRPLRDHVRGKASVTEIIQRSSNVGAAKLALELGNQRFEAYLRAFGFGSRLGIDLPGEENGILAPARRWATISPTRLAIGQGIAATGLQMLSLYSTLANDGIMMRPYAIKQVRSPCGEILHQGQPEMIGRPIRPEVARQMREMLSKVTEPGGTATRAAIAHYRVAGKTGTAQIPIAGGYSQTEYWASFVGFLPSEHPEITILVVIERPQPQRTGGVVAAPVFARIGESVAHYLELLPSATIARSLADANRERLAGREGRP